MEKHQPSAADTIHKAALVIDAHSDVHLEVLRRRGRGETRVLERLFYDRWQEGGYDVVVLSTITKFGLNPHPYHASPVKNFLLMADAIAQEIAESPSCFFLVRTPADMRRAPSDSRIGLILGMEGAEPVDTDLALLRCYWRLSLRVLTLTWHQRNQVADGVAEPSNAGLSHFGRSLIEEMNRLGMLIDVSHLSPAGVRDVLAISTQPVIASHSNARALCDHPRNLDDEQIRAIAAKGGVIGVVFLGRFVSSTDPTLSDVLDHVDHIAKVAGVEHVAVGPDHVDRAADLIIQSRRVAGPGQPVDDPYIPYARGVERIEDLPAFTQGLVERGYTDRQVEGILGGNYLRVFQAVYRG